MTDVQQRPSLRSATSPTSSEASENGSSITVVDQDPAGAWSMVDMNTFGKDLSLEEAVELVQTLMKDNQELREMARQYNELMQTANKNIQQVKHNWEKEKEEVRQRHEQTRDLVTAMRKDIAEKENKISLLLQQVDELQRWKDEERATPSMKHEQRELANELDENKGPLEDNSAALQRALDEQAALQQDYTALQKELAVKDEDFERMQKQLDEASRQSQQLEVEVENLVEMSGKLKATNSRLLEEKHDLLKMNNQLSSELHDCKGQLASRPAAEPFIVLESEEGEQYVVTDHEPAEGHQEEEEQQQGPTARPKRVQELGAAGPSAQLDMSNPPSTVSTYSAEYKKPADIIDGGGERMDSLGLMVDRVQQEKHQKSELLAKRQKDEHLIGKLQAELHEKEQLLIQARTELNMTVTQLKSEHQQTMDRLSEERKSLTAEIKQAKDKDEEIMLHKREVGNMQSQVLSLVHEIQESQKRGSGLSEANDKYKERVCQLEDKMRLYQQEMDEQRGHYEGQRASDDQMIESLRLNINTLETNFAAAKESNTTKSKSLKGLRDQFDKLCKDYGQLQTTYASYKQEQEAASRSGGAVSLNVRREYEEKIDNLTAQLVSAEECMEARAEEVQDLKRRLEAGSRDVNAQVEAHRAQADVYRQDFEAEREAREQQNQEKERMRDEMELWKRKHHQLQERLDEAAAGRAPVRNPDIPAPAGGNWGGVYTGLEDVVHPTDGPAGHPGQGSVPHSATTEEESPYVCPMCQYRAADYNTILEHVEYCVQ